MAHPGSVTGFIPAECGSTSFAYSSGRRAEVALARRYCELVGGQQGHDHVILERVALGKHLDERVEDHHQAGFDGVVVHADRIAQDGVDPVLPRPRKAVIRTFSGRLLS